MTTMDDVHEEAKRFNLPSHVILKKHLVFVITFENSGQLSATDVEISMQLIYDTWKLDYPPVKLSELAGGEEQNYMMNFFLDVNSVPGRIEHFISTAKYEYAGQKYIVNRTLEYDMFRNAWGFE